MLKDVVSSGVQKGQGCNSPRHPLGGEHLGQTEAASEQSPSHCVVAVLTSNFFPSLCPPGNPLFHTLTSTYEESEQNMAVISTMNKGKIYKPGKITDTWHYGLEIKLQLLAISGLTDINICKTRPSFPQ